MRRYIVDVVPEFEEIRITEVGTNGARMGSTRFVAIQAVNGGAPASIALPLLLKEFGIEPQSTSEAANE